MDAWQRLYRDEQEALDFLLREEFTEMTDNWFVQHPEVIRYILKHEQVAAAIATECRIAREQAELQAAWDELQNVPSYVEREASAFVKEQDNER